MKRDFKESIVFGDIYRNTISYNNMSIRTKKYKILWHIGEYFQYPKEESIIVARYENNWVQILRVDSNLDTDDIIEWAYLNDLI